MDVWSYLLLITERKQWFGDSYTLYACGDLNHLFFSNTPFKIRLLHLCYQLVLIRCLIRHSLSWLNKKWSPGLTYTLQRSLSYTAKSAVVKSCLSAGEVASWQPFVHNYCSYSYLHCQLKLSQLGSSSLFSIQFHPFFYYLCEFVLYYTTFSSYHTLWLYCKRDVPWILIHCNTDAWQLMPCHSAFFTFNVLNC